jgi:YHS domain-containing protein
MKQFFGIIVVAAIVVACNSSSNNHAGTDHQATSTDTTAMMAGETEITYDTALVANKKDPVCRMPVRMGVYDTAHFKNEVLGFCSVECKTAFVTKPEDYKLEMKH